MVKYVNKWAQTVESLNYRQENGSYIVNYSGYLGSMDRPVKMGEAVIQRAILV